MGDISNKWKMRLESYDKLTMLFEVDGINLLQNRFLCQVCLRLVFSVANYLIHDTFNS